LEKFGSICHFRHCRHTNTLEVQIAVKTEGITTAVKQPRIHIYASGAGDPGPSRIFFDEMLTYPAILAELISFFLSRLEIWHVQEGRHLCSCFHKRSGA